MRWRESEGSAEGREGRGGREEGKEWDVTCVCGGQHRVGGMRFSRFKLSTYFYFIYEWQMGVEDDENAVLVAS